MRIVFMGTPDFAVPVLEAAMASGHEIVGVYTQPDKPTGRKQILTPSAVKICAEQAGIPVYQPVRIKRKQYVTELADLKPDLILVAAYGQILSQAILDIPRYGCMNMHASLLPKYRGAAPIQRAIVCGETETGITAMMMNAGMDTGDILEKTVVPIEEQDTAETLHDKLAEAAGKLTRVMLARIEQEGRLTGLPQDEEEATYAPMLSREDGAIDFHRSAAEVYNQVRGLYPWPGTYTYWNDQKLAIFETAKTERPAGTAQPGTVHADGKSMYVACRDTWIEVLSLQLQGRKRMDAKSFLQGNHPDQAVFQSSRKGDRI